MSLNLISDAWIPVRHSDGSRAVIAPHRIADPGIKAPDWPRADLNLACYELLIGLVAMADPPADRRDWRRPADPDRLRDRLAAFAPAFELLGDGPRLLQDSEDLEGSASTPDLLFIDSAGGNTARNNADLMVHRDRYPALDLPLAAMALYAFQQFAPSGGAGNRTSMRGGGPLVTLVDPGGSLWDLIWANVPYGTPARPEDLPWMRPTRTSERGQIVTPDQSHPVEAFFGMPRRLRLIGEDRVTGVVQRPYGTNYAAWVHPLSPYYRLNRGTELLPKHPATGNLPYRHWEGIVLAAPPGDGADRRHRATSVSAHAARHLGSDAPLRLILGGWAMDNMKPKDFLWSELPLLPMADDAAPRAAELIGAAGTVASGLLGALAPVLAEGSARDGEIEAFWAETEPDFVRALRGLTAVNFDWSGLAARFLQAIGGKAMRRFETRALPGLAERRMKDAEAIVAAHRHLRGLVGGWSKPGRKLWEGLDLSPPERPKQLEEQA